MILRLIQRFIFHLILVSFGLLLVAIFLSQEWRLTGELAGVPLDDSWIHYRFASNLRSGQGFSFNPGVPTPGSTSPLWVVLLSLFGSGYIIPSKLLGILAYLGVGLLLYQLCLTAGLERSLAFLAGMSTLAAGRLLWAAPSGMETTTFTLVSLLAIWLYACAPVGRIPVSVSVVFGLACLLRPEGYLLLGISGFVWLVSQRERWRDPGNILNLCKHLAVAGLVILPYIGFSLLTTGNPLPNTFYAKHSIGCTIGAGYFLFAGMVFFLDNPVMGVLAVLGLAWGLRSRDWKLKPWLILSALWLLGVPLLYGFVSPCVSGYATRYTTHLVPVMMLFGGTAARRLESLAPSWFNKFRQGMAHPPQRSRLGRLLISEGIILSLAPILLFWAPYYGQSVADIQHMQVNIGRWLGRHTTPADILALNDVGAIATLSNRKVIDLIGLTSPEVIPLIAGKSPGSWDATLGEYLSEQQPDYLVVFPHWYPQMVKILPVEEVYQVQLMPRTIAGFPNLTVAGGGEMIVYKLNWPK